MAAAEAQLLLSLQTDGLLCSQRGGLSSVFLSRPLITVSSKRDKIAGANTIYFATVFSKMKFPGRLVSWVF